MHVSPRPGIPFWSVRKSFHARVPFEAPLDAAGSPAGHSAGRIRPDDPILAAEAPALARVELLEVRYPDITAGPSDNAVPGTELREEKRIAANLARLELDGRRAARSAQELSRASLAARRLWSLAAVELLGGKAAILRRSRPGLAKPDHGTSLAATGPPPPATVTATPASTGCGLQPALHLGG